MKNKYDNHNCLEQGLSAEKAFEELAISKGYTTTKSTKDENINKHIDLYITKNNKTYSIDIKASKKVSRKDSIPRYDLLWIELHSVRPNNKGWLYDGKADFIAFQTKDCFLIIKRTKLIELIPLYTEKTFVTNPSEALNKLYQRPGRVDILTLLDVSSILPYCYIWGF